MTNNYIKISMIPTKHGIGGSFVTKANFKLDNMKMPLYNVEVKIDTGCSISTITAKKLNIPLSKLSQLKIEDIENNIAYHLSYGVETGGQRHTEPRTFNEKMKCSAMKFEHSISDFTINGVKISNKTIHINYDRTSNILIGMDILKDWDIHIGTVDDSDLVEYGETIFIACPKDQINDDYLLELERLFGTITSMKLAKTTNEISKELN